MNLPSRFDANEWFILAATVLIYTVILFMPRRFPLSQSLYIWVFNLFLANLVDYVIATKPLDLYDVNDGPDYELFDLLLYLLLYGPAAYVIIYFYDRWKPKGWAAALYVTGWALITIVLEWLAVMFRVYQFHAWTHLYSIPSYIALYTLNLAMFRLLRSLYAKKPGA